MGKLGGGMTHAGMGMRVWADEVRLISGVGNDFPEELLGQMGALFDLQGIIRRDWATPRAWQLFEENGHRGEVFRVPMDQFIQTAPRPHEIPANLLAVEGVHSQGGTPEEYFPWIERLREANCPFVLWEPWELMCQREKQAIFFEMANLADGVSPNLEEGCQLTGKKDALEILHILLDHCPLAALRMGAEGSLLARRGGPVYRVSTVPVPKIVDVTGAGNAYCGGLVVGLCTTGDLVQAAKYAAVAASFALEQFGALYSLDGVREQAYRRLEQVVVEQID